MTSLTKVVLALLLLAGGFIAAKTFGPPELAKRLADSWRPESPSQWDELQPAASRDHQTEWLAPLGAMEMPTHFNSGYSQQPEAAPLPPAAQHPLAALPHTTAKPPAAPAIEWPPMPALGGEPTNDAPFMQPAVQTSSFEEEMVDLRHFATPPAHDPPSQPVVPTESAPSAEPWPSAPAAPVKEVSTGASDAWPPFVGPPAEGQPAPAMAASSDGFGDFHAPPADAWLPTPSSEPLTSLPAEPFPTSEPPPSRTHIVTDGDSLPKLAQRYLGDAARSAEIYDQNRDELTHPDLLPLGVELKLP